MPGTRSILISGPGELTPPTRQHCSVSTSDEMFDAGTGMPTNAMYA